MKLKTWFQILSNELRLTKEKIPITVRKKIKAIFDICFSSIASDRVIPDLKITKLTLENRSRMAM